MRTPNTKTPSGDLRGLISTWAKELGISRLYRVGNADDPMDYSYPITVSFRDIIDENYLPIEDIPSIYDLPVGEAFVDTSTSVTFLITRIE